VISLAVRSLAYISDDYILDISHIGFINGLLEETHLPDDQKKALTNALNLKNSSAIGKICEKGKVEPKICEALMSLTTLYGPIADTISRLEKFNFNEKTADAIDELKNIYKILTAMKCSDNINLNCSIENDMNYYNGITFHGFVGGVPFGVVSGGRYDKLVRKFGKRGGAIGFAIYLDRLESLFTSSKDYDVDVLLLYDKDTDRIKLAKLVERFAAEGKSVTADTRIPSAIRYRTIVNPDDTEVE
jgi:ATP phosphoribosyltransferase regulatory subunit